MKKKKQLNLYRIWLNIAHISVETNIQIQIFEYSNTIFPIFQYLLPSTTGQWHHKMMMIDLSAKFEFLCETC